ncbi:hypothetical protein FA95DRAFT_1462483, partial [Auriscalpium vulgare]
MLKAARTFDVSLNAVRLSANLQAQLPAWYNLGERRRPLGRASKCLRDTHAVLTVADLLRVSARLRPRPGVRRHATMSRCACPDCRTDRASACPNPHKCAEEAITVLRHMGAKMDPMQARPRDGLTLTHHRLKTNEDARANKGTILFDPSVTAKTSLAECFRVFTTTAALSHEPGERLRRP